MDTALLHQAVNNKPPPLTRTPLIIKTSATWPTLLCANLRGEGVFITDFNIVDLVSITLNLAIFPPSVVLQLLCCVQALEVEVSS